MRKDITEETKQRLIPIYEQVEKDFKEFPYIKTTEDFFIWRSQIKETIEEELKNTDKENDDEYKDQLRDKIIKDKIKDNKSLELLYDWANFYIKVDESKANLRLTNYQYGIEDNDHIIKASSLLHNQLAKQGKANANDLSNILQISELNLLVKYPPMQRTISSPYEFERAVVKEDESEAWSAPLFITFLRAYGVDGEDLLEVSKQVESLSKKYIKEIENKNTNTLDVSSKKYVYDKRG